MRKAITAIALTLMCATLALAQGVLPPTYVTTEQFNAWSFQSQAANTYTFAGTNCNVSPLTTGVYPFFAFGPSSAPYPVLIADADPTKSEIVTPSAVSTVAGACGFSASPANSHISFTVSSGTAGLQEAVGTLGSAATPVVPWTVVIDKGFYSAVSALPGSKSVPGIIGALKGTTGVQIVDITTAPFTYYKYNGTNYVVGGISTLAPTVAYSTGAGTSPTNETIVGNAATGTVSFTSGTTPTASATVFTLTFASLANGGFSYAPSCTIVSVGTNAYTTGTVGTVAGPPAVATFTASSTALTASTAYKFAYTCQ